MNAQSKDGFYFRMHGDAMQDAGINDNDLLWVKTNAVPQEGDTILAQVDHDMLVRKFFLDNGQVILMAENVNMPSILIEEESEFQVCGVVEKL